MSLIPVTTGIEEFTSSGAFEGSWGSYSSYSGGFINPMGITVDSGGHVYVADTGNNRIQKFFTSGTVPATGP